MPSINAVQITSDEYAQCVKFAEEVVHTNKVKYGQRSQTDIAKIKFDIRVGKMAEWAVYHYVKQRDKQQRPVDAPDFEIFEATPSSSDAATKKRKSFDADLTIGDVELHVKAQSTKQACYFGESWSFQTEDPLTYRPTANEYVVFCLVDETTRLVAVRSILPASDLLEQKMFRDPKKQNLVGIKKVIYYEDVEQMLAQRVKQ